MLPKIQISGLVSFFFRFPPYGGAGWMVLMAGWNNKGDVVSHNSSHLEDLFCDPQFMSFSLGLGSMTRSVKRKTHGPKTWDPSWIFFGIWDRLSFGGKTVDGSEIRWSPVEVGSLFHYLQGFLHSRWLFVLFLNHQQYQFWVSHQVFCRSGEESSGFV